MPKPEHTMPDWRHDAACRDIHSDAFFPLPTEDTTDARMTCLDCPVRRACAQDAYDEGEKYGIRAGFLLDKEANELRRYLGVGARTCETCGGEFQTKFKHTTCHNCRSNLVVGEEITKVREHLRQLLDYFGWSINELALEAGVAHTTVAGLVSGERSATKPETAAKLLAFNPGRPAGMPS